jgi:hypothetical protein
VGGGVPVRALSQVVLGRGPALRPMRHCTQAASTWLYRTYSTPPKAPPRDITSHHVTQTQTDTGQTRVVTAAHAYVAESWGRVEQPRDTHASCDRRACSRGCGCLRAGRPYLQPVAQDRVHFHDLARLDLPHHAGGGQRPVAHLGERGGGEKGVREWREREAGKGR